MTDPVHAWLNCTGFPSIPVGDRPLLVGRSKTADLVLPHESVSRKHAVIAFREGKFRLKNLSPMGLLHNRTEIEAGAVVDLGVGDEVTIGPFVLRIDDFPVRQEDQDEEEPTLPFGITPRRKQPRPPPPGRPPGRPPTGRPPTGRPRRPPPPRA